MSLRPLALAAAIAVGIVVPAHAAYTVASVNLRVGPGVGYPIITTARPGNRVDVHTCVPGWCEVNYAGIVGWMSASYIAGGPGSPRYFVQPAPYIAIAPLSPGFRSHPRHQRYYEYERPNPGPYFSFGFGSGGSSFGFGYGTPWWW